MQNHFRAHFALYQSENPDLELQLARVTRVDRGRVVVNHEHSLPFRAGLQCAVGDYVVVEDNARVRAILERRQVLARRASGSEREAQLVAANVDVVVVVHASDDVNLARVERGVEIAHQCDARALVVLTKSDLHDALEEVRSRVRDEVIATSSTDGSGLAALRDALSGVTAVMIGPSGAGKSSLVNALFDEEHMATSAVRTDDKKGRHTTTQRVLFELPGGGALIDTPGTRELGLLLDDGEGPLSFSDIDALAQDCRFRDCAHQGEEGCAVEHAINPARLESYRKQSRELRYLSEKDHERRARFKAFAGTIKSRKKLKGR